MADRRTNAGSNRLARLWQLPLLVLSLGLFGFAAFLFVHPGDRFTLDQKISRAAALLHGGHPDTAAEQLGILRIKEKLTPEQDARIHLLQADTIAARATQKNEDLSADQKAIVQHLKQAIAAGAHPDADLYSRIAQIEEGLGRTSPALEDYRKAIALDARKTPRLRRKVIDLELAGGDDKASDASLGEYLKDTRLTDQDRAWALGERSRIRVDHGDLESAKSLLAAALKLSVGPAAKGEVNYRLGYCEWKQGHTDEAERLLRVSREQLGTVPPVDADAAQLLGQVLEEKKQPAEAISFFEAVLRDHPDSPLVPLARLGRGVCRIDLSQDDAGLVDLNEVVRQIDDRPVRAKFKPDAMSGLQHAARQLALRGAFKLAIEVLSLEQRLVPEPSADFLAQLAGVYEKRADQIEQSAADAPDDQARSRQQEQARDLRTKAGDAWVAFGRSLTVKDDQGNGEGLWKGIELYDQAGDAARAIAALERFVNERPDDPRTPQALLKLGQAYRTAGLFDKAIAAFRRDQARYPQYMASVQCGVPLAQAYQAKGPDFYPPAEKALRSTLESQLITPAAEDFKNALFELGRLYHRTTRYEQAVSRLEEWADRYPQDRRLGQTLFLTADSYRKSAELLKPTKIPTTAPAMTTLPSQIQVARRQRLQRAQSLYDRVIDQLKAPPSPDDADALYLKLAYFYRADCAYDLGQYEQAIHLYDAAALRYENDPASLAAYVQIVNAYLALGRPEEAKTANERAKWLLRRMPASVFKDDRFSMPKKYWEDWLAWSSSAGMW